MNRIHQFSDGLTVTIDDSMVIEGEGFILAGDFNPHNVRPWVIGHEFGPVVIVFASCEQDAIDEAVDAGKLDCFLIEDHECAEDCEALHAGNADEPLDQTYMWIRELPNPPFSFIACLNAAVQEGPA